MRFLKTLLLLVLACLLPARLHAAESAESVMKRASARISQASTVSASFAVSSPSFNAKGTLKAKGKRFALLSDASSSWYDGSRLWTYSPATAETTLVTPSSSDLLECNPLLYISNASAFRAMYTKVQPKGMKRIVLVPRRSMPGVKNVEVTLDARSLLPRTIVVTSPSAGRMTVSVTGLRLNAPVKDSEFTYPKSKYPKTKIIDLR